MPKVINRITTYKFIAVRNYYNIVWPRARDATPNRIALEALASPKILFSLITYAWGHVINNDVNYFI